MARAPRAAAGLLSWPVVAPDRIATPIWDPSRQLLFVGDVRLYNRRDVANSLGIPGYEDRPDLEIAWLAYLKWGESAVDHLLGDFAFVVWDELRGEMFVARDQVGIRPLYYYVDNGRILIASDVAQIVKNVRRRLRIDAQTVVERLMGRPRTKGKTYFQNIAALPGGHSALISSTGVRCGRYWSPKLDTISVSYREHCSDIRDLFIQAVRVRLDSDYPIVAHSSGGFDSSSIVMAADRVYRNETGRPPLVLASATANGMACDDSQYMDAVSSNVLFGESRWSALDRCADDLIAPASRLRISNGELEEAPAGT